MIFMGTGSAQLIPAAFCECDYCTEVRHSADRRNVRGRSGFQIDEKNLIDFGPDTHYTAALYNISFRKTENIFFTHTHPDHFSFSNCEDIRRGMEPVSLNMWFPASARESMREYYEFALAHPLFGTLKDNKYMQDHIPVHFVKPYETFRAGDMDVTPVLANHPGLFDNETGLNYMFERNGKRFLYACDTGLWCDENYEFLKNKPADVIIIECTFGLMDIPRDAKHLNLAMMEEIVRRLEKVGVYTENTKLYGSHFCHQCGLLHAEMDAKFKEVFGPNAFAGYDGLEIAPF